jgi:hypothetical protein
MGRVVGYEGGYSAERARTVDDVYQSLLIVCCFSSSCQQFLMDRPDVVDDVTVSNSYVRVAVETNEERASGEGVVGVARVTHVCHRIYCCSSREGRSGLHIVLKVGTVFFLFSVGVGRRVGGRSPGTPGSRFRVGFIFTVIVVSPRKGGPRCRGDDGIVEGSIAAPPGWRRWRRQR